MRRQVSPSWAVHEHYILRLLCSLARRPDEVVLLWRDEAITRWQLSGRILRAASALHGQGIGPGSTVAVLTRVNSPEMLVARYAAHLVGAAVVYVHSANPRTGADLLPEQVQAELLDVVAATVLVTDLDHLARARSLAAGHGRPLLLAASGLDADGVLRLDVDSPTPVRSVTCRPDDTAIITFTSGTTGRPKAIAQPYRVWNATVTSFSSSTHPVDPATFLAVLPLSYTIGSMLDSVVIGGGRVVLKEGFDADDVLRTVATTRVTDTYLAVPYLYRLLEHPRLADTDLTSLRRVIYSGSPAAPHRITAAVDGLGDCLHQLYGSTECGGITCLTPPDHQDPDLRGTVGRPLPGVSLGIVDPDTGRELSSSTAVGEICVRARTVMSRYLDDAEGGRGDGWLHTGDLGYLDHRGYLTLTGRLGDVVKSGGLKIYPSAVADVLMAHPAIEQAVVFGVEDRDRREHVHAAIVVRPGAHCPDEDLSALVTGRLGPVHVPSTYHRWAELPLTDRGKPDVPQLRSHATRPAAQRPSHD